MANPADGGGGSASAASILAYERTLGSYAWEGPQGNADAWLLLQLTLSQVIPAHQSFRNALALDCGRLG